MIVRALIALVTLTVACAPSYNFGPAARGEVEATSLVALLASPHDFNGRRVWVGGVANFEFEGNALFLTEEHYRHHLSQYAVWLRPNLEILGVQWYELSRLNGRYVLVEQSRYPK